MRRSVIALAAASTLLASAPAFAYGHFGGGGFHGGYGGGFHGGYGGGFRGCYGG